MNIFGLTISRSKAVNPASLSSPATAGGMSSWFPIIRESFAGAWQQNVEVSTADVLTHATVYACITLIASDIGKLRIKLVQQDVHDVWTETEAPAFSPVLRKPNLYQTRIQFLQQWVTSKLVAGNAYILKERDGRTSVVGMHALDPSRVRVLVSDLDGSVYYSLNTDNLSGVGESVVVPASEIIHDRMNPMYHPLVGVSPITACGLAAVQGLRIQENSTLFFKNGASPAGVLSSDQVIKNDQAKELSDRWQSQYGGANSGKVAVLGNGLKYQQMMMSAVDSQLIDQLKWTSETICSAFHVPPYMVGVGQAPTYNNIEALNQQYYAQCLQNLIESIELLLDEGLGLDTTKPSASGAKRYGTELDLDGLLRMDTMTRTKAATEAIRGGLSPNEVRQKYHDVGPVQGGESPMMQEQNYSLAALAKRDARPDPFAKGTSTPVSGRPVEADDPEEDEVDEDVSERALRDLFRREMALERAA